MDDPGCSVSTGRLDQGLEDVCRDAAAPCKFYFRSTDECSSRDSRKIFNSLQSAKGALVGLLAEMCLNNAAHGFSQI